MAAKVHLNHFRFSIYIDPDGTVTLTDLPPELREVVDTLNPSTTTGTSASSSQHKQAMSADGRRHGDTAQISQPEDEHG